MVLQIVNGENNFSLYHCYNMLPCDSLSFPKNCFSNNKTTLVTTYHVTKLKWKFFSAFYEAFSKLCTKSLPFIQIQIWNRICLAPESGQLESKQLKFCGDQPSVDSFDCSSQPQSYHNVFPVRHRNGRWYSSLLTSYYRLKK